MKAGRASIPCPWGQAAFGQLGQDDRGKRQRTAHELTRRQPLSQEQPARKSRHDRLQRQNERGNRGVGVPLADDLQDPALKVPHIGWNALHLTPGRADDPLFRYIRDGEYVYYVHSYYAKHCDASTLATSDYSIPVTGAVRRGLVYGTQFHPEKSGDTGLRLLKAFVEL